MLRIRSPFSGWVSATGSRSDGPGLEEPRTRIVIEHPLVVEDSEPV